MKIKNGWYLHYKGKLYYVTGLAKHTETEESLVVYHFYCEASSAFVRPLAMFCEPVTWQDGVERPRFVYLRTKNIAVAAMTQETIMTLLRLGSPRVNTFFCTTGAAVEVVMPRRHGVEWDEGTAEGESGRAGA